MPDSKHQQSDQKSSHGHSGGEKEKTESQQHPQTAPPETPKIPAKKVDSDDDEGNEVLEESPCGRWQKRREQVRI